MNKDAYVEKLKAQLDEWNADLDKLEAKARGAKADAQIKHEEQLASLRQHRDQAKQKLNEIQLSAGGAWEHLKQGAEDAWTRLKDAVTKAKSQFD